MKSVTLGCLTAVCLLLALSLATRLSAQRPSHTLPRYTVTDLGTLGGRYSQANGINNRALVTGFTTLPGDAVLHAFRWQNGVLTDLGTLGGPTSFTPDDNHLISERGDIVGSADDSIPDPNGEDVCGDGTHLRCLPFVWHKGIMTALPLLGGNNGAAGGINSRDQIVGVAENPRPDPTCSPFFLQTEAVVWQKSHVQELHPISGDPDGFANAINDGGQVVGVTGCVTGTFHAVLWQNGMPLDLGNLGGVSGNIAFDINNQGQIVGQSDLSGDTTHHAFLWQNGVMADLGTILGLPLSLANGINNEGQVVGFSQDLDSNNTVAWIWQGGAMTDLNTLIPADSRWFLIEALGINDRGQIVGPAFDTITGDLHGYLLTPVEGSENVVPDAQSGLRERPPVVLPENVRQLLERRAVGREWLGSSQRARDAAVISAPNAILSPTSLTFATQAIGTASAAKTVTLTNTGTASLTINAIGITGINSGDYVQSHTCGSSLAVGANCMIRVSFKPRASGTRTAALIVNDNATGSPQKVTLSGTGTSAKLSPTSLNFGNVAFGTTSSPEAVTLTNVGETTFNIAGIAITGINARDFTQTNACGGSLAPGVGCNISVTFKPIATGTRTAAVSFTDNAVGSPQSISLTGTGVAGSCKPYGALCQTFPSQCCAGLQCAYCGLGHLCCL